MALDWLRWRAWAAVDAVVAAAVGVAGMALGDIDRRFAWQVWRLLTSTVTLRGTRGTWRHRHFAWQAWHLWHWTGSGGALGPQWTPLSPRLLAWQAWHLVTSNVTLRGRRGTCGTGLAPVARLARSGRRCRCGCWRGKRGASSHPPSLCVAGVALEDIDRHFAWQAWHLVTSTVTLRGRHGTYGTGLALVARLGLRWTPLLPRLLAWQAWHLVTWTLTLRGRRGPW